ncbi:MAG: HIT domain-containing protein [Nitrososphaerota archaeon]
MDRLWAPWRMAYIGGQKTQRCIFCRKPKERNDRANLIIMRGETCFVMLNAYPYNNGHLMTAPYRHVGDIRRLSMRESSELMMLSILSIDLLMRALNPMGFNIGMNLGRIAGAGIADHVHMHIVPRWAGDTNYMPVIADTKVLPEYLDETYSKLLEHLPQNMKAKLQLTDNSR